MKILHPKLGLVANALSEAFTEAFESGESVSIECNDVVVTFVPRFKRTAEEIQKRREHT